MSVTFWGYTKYTTPQGTVEWGEAYHNTEPRTIKDMIKWVEDYDWLDYFEQGYVIHETIIFNLEYECIMHRVFHPIT